MNVKGEIMEIGCSVTYVSEKDNVYREGGDLRIWTTGRLSLVAIKIGIQFSAWRLQSFSAGWRNIQ